MKPDWNKVPEKYNYMAQDLDGFWSVFEREPYIGPLGIQWISNEPFIMFENLFEPDESDVKKAKGSWTESLEKRP
jgi:hypothetical protein